MQPISQLPWLAIVFAVVTGAFFQQCTGGPSSTSASAVQLEAAAPDFRKSQRVPGLRFDSLGMDSADSASLDTSKVLVAMRAELHRSMDSLQEENAPKPYFLSYLLWDVQSWHLVASLGSIEKAEPRREHYLAVDLRVGSPELDNTHFQGNVVFGPELRHPLPEDNHPGLLRQALWSATDAQYKVAVENLAQKKAYLQSRQESNPLPDFQPWKARLNISQDSAAFPDSSLLKRRMEEWSAQFQAYPWLSESRMAFQYYYTTLYYVDSEGSAYIQGFQEHTLLASLLCQASDGQPLWDYYRLSRREPLSAALIDSVPLQLQNRLARLDVLRGSQLSGFYRGPVLFSGPAAGEVIYRSLLRPQERLRPNLGPHAEPPFLLDLENRRFLPRHISIIDRPSARSFRGRLLHGHYLFDHQSRPAQPVRLVHEGMLTDFYRGREPLKSGAAHASNGHWRYGGGFPGVALVHSQEGLPEGELLGRLRSLAKEEGLAHGLVVSRFLDEDAFALLRHPLADWLVSQTEADSRGNFALPLPVAVDRVEVTDGSVHPVRGLGFTSVDTKSLRHLEATGEELRFFEPQASLTVLSPDLLFSLLDMRSMGSSFPRLPVLGNSDIPQRFRFNASGDNAHKLISPGRP